MRRGERIVTWGLRVYALVLLVFIFTPIVASTIFSFNSQRFPTVPLGSFTTEWYQTILADPDVWAAVRTSIIVAVCSSVIATS